MNQLPANHIWDEKHVKALLGLRRYPLSLVQMEPWHSWLTAHGGIGHILEYLRSAPFSTSQKELLGLILAQPDASPIFFAGKLHLGQSAYFLRLADLIRAICAHLNAWKPITPVPTLHNLPAPLTPLVGADETIALVVSMLERPGIRLLTLMGPGGVGKTRLAIAAGSRLLATFPDGVFFVSLETVVDPALLPSQIARSLNIETKGVPSLMDALQAYFHPRQMLLILDNFEQLVAAGLMVVTLLKAAPQLKVMVTSREALQQYGEYRFVIPELMRPSPENPLTLDQLEQWPAINLFIQRVRTLHPLFSLNDANREVIVRICDQLDGLPLAIELAAAQVKILTPEQTLPPLGGGLKNLRGASRDQPQRQRTLWDAIDWSYQLLPEAEKALFRQLAVFGRIWSTEAAQQVCQIPDAEIALDELSNKSLVRRISQTHFQMLQAVREYALDQLQNNPERGLVRRRHASYYRDFVIQAERHMVGVEQAIWTEHIKQEHENLQIALQWMLDSQETEMAFTLLGAAWRFWDVLNIWSETRLWMDRALTQGAHLKSAAHAATLWGASWLAAHQSDYVQALAFAEQGLALARELDEPQWVGRLLQNVADGYYREGETERGIALVEESLLILRDLGDREEMAWALDHLGWGLRERGEYTRSREVLQESLSIFREIGHRWAIAYSLGHLGRYALEDHDYETAAALLTESLTLSRVIGGKQRISEILRELAFLTWQRGNLVEAQTMLEEGLALSHEVGDRAGEGWALNLMGQFALEYSDVGAARSFYEKARQLFYEVGESAAIAYNLACFKQLDEKQQND